MKKYLLVLSAIVFLFVGVPGVVLADTHTAASANVSDVQTAVNAASNGDTVQIPAGTATWTSSLSITKS
ncbi:MAG: hypothetical protein WCW87_03715, partial [Candidatus Paceibacterota bacterium]